MKTPFIFFSLLTCLIMNGCLANHKQEVSVPEKNKPAHSALIPLPNPEKSIQDWWMPRHRAVNLMLSKGNIDLLFIGNSIVNGFEGAGKQIWDKYYGSRKAINMGFGWDRTQHLLWRLNNNDFTNISPKLAIVLIGTNNIGRNSVNEIVEGITAVCQNLKSRLPATKILLLGIFPRFKESSADRDIIKEINLQISKLDDQKIIYYLDIGSAFLDSDRKISTEIMHDLLHPTTKGYQLFAETIEPKVKELLGER